MKQKFRAKGYDFGVLFRKLWFSYCLYSVSVLYVFQKNGHRWVNTVTFVSMQVSYKTQILSKGKIG